AGSALAAVEHSLLNAKLWPTLIVWFLIFAVFTWGFGFVININKFSLHALYRNRLMRAYLGASNPDRMKSQTYNPFTGFDTNDNIRLCHIGRVEAAPPNKPASESTANSATLPQPLPLRPFPVINMALNLVGGKELAWQERKAESFTASPLHCGCGQLGYR